MPTIEALRRSAYKAQRALSEAETKQTDKRNAKLVGRCFRYHNSGGGCDTKWWLYVRVLRVEDGHLRVFKFQEMPDGRIEIEPSYFKMAVSLEDGGYIPIQTGEFNKAWADVKSKISALETS